MAVVREKQRVVLAEDTTVAEKLLIAAGTTGEVVRVNGRLLQVRLENQFILKDADVVLFTAEDGGALERHPGLNTASENRLQGKRQRTGPEDRKAIYAAVLEARKLLRDGGDRQAAVDVLKESDLTPHGETYLREMLGHLVELAESDASEAYAASLL
ncbi:hypothetical protein [Streptomyces sp. NBC_00648]|uniref:hypothetical protein n=1 Tax=Streptomyces sp. NBC_00648 TaxID=2975797 RepID=UPI003252A74E